MAIAWISMAVVSALTRNCSATHFSTATATPSASRGRDLNRRRGAERAWPHVQLVRVSRTAQRVSLGVATQRGRQRDGGDEQGSRG